MVTFFRQHFKIQNWCQRKINVHAMTSRQPRQINNSRKVGAWKRGDVKANKKKEKKKKSNLHQGTIYSASETDKSSFSVVMISFKAATASSRLIVLIARLWKEQYHPAPSPEVEYSLSLSNRRYWRLAIRHSNWSIKKTSTMIATCWLLTRGQSVHQVPWRLPGSRNGNPHTNIVNPSEGQATSIFQQLWQFCCSCRLEVPVFRCMSVQKVPRASCSMMPSEWWNLFDANSFHLCVMSTSCVPCL